jgi:hypothetical protein
MATPANAQSSLLINYGAYLNGNHSYSIGVANNSPNEGTATVLWADQSQEGLASLQWPVPTGQAIPIYVGLITLPPVPGQINLPVTACASDAGNSYSAGASVVNWPCNAGTPSSHLWTAQPATLPWGASLPSMAGHPSTACYTFSNALSGLYLGVANNSAAEGAAIIQWTKGGVGASSQYNYFSPNQIWCVAEVPAGPIIY